MYQPITYNLLKSKNACVEQLKSFRKHFGVKKSIPLTKAVARKFGTLFDVSWAAQNLLTREDNDEYNKVCDQAYDEYNKVCNQAYAEYEKVRDQARVEYDKVCDQAYDEYVKVRAQSYDEYVKVCAVEFVRIYKRGLTSEKSQ